MKTPIQQWPPRQFKGRLGYSETHYAMLAGAPEDPLSVAARFAYREAEEPIRLEGAAMLHSGEDPAAVLEWQTRELAAQEAASWQKLCLSFDEVAAVLARAPQNPAIKRLLREVSRARRLA